MYGLFATYRRVFTGILPALLVVAIAGCSDDTIGPDEDVGTIAITVQEGLNPTYTWTGGPIMRLTVSREKTPNTIVRGVETSDTNGIAGPVIHGVLPADTALVDTSVTVTLVATGEDTLIDGMEYLVTVRREDGTFGQRPFIP